MGPAKLQRLLIDLISTNGFHRKFPINLSKIIAINDVQYQKTAHMPSFEAKNVTMKQNTPGRTTEKLWQSIHLRGYKRAR